MIPKPGTGYGGDEPDKYMFFVSDGVADHAKSLYCTKRTAGSTRCQEPIDIKYCDKIKKKGVKIGWGYYFRVGITLTTPILLVTLAALALRLSLA